MECKDDELLELKDPWWFRIAYREVAPVNGWRTWDRRPIGYQLITYPWKVWRWITRG